MAGSTDRSVPDETNTATSPASSDVLLAVAQMVPDAIFVIDRNGRYVFCNVAAEKFFGRPEADIIGKDDATLLGADADTIRMQDQRVMTAGLEESEEHLISAAGGTRYYQVSRAPWRDRAGVVLGVIRIARDITAQREAEETVRQLVVGSSCTGVDYFKLLVSTLCEVCQCEYAFIGELHEKEPAIVQTISVARHGKNLENFQYPLKGTPCESVVRDTFCHYSQSVQQLFPEDHLLVQLNIGSYMGFPLFASTGESLGLLVLLNNRPFANSVQAESVLKVVAARTAAELERERAAQALRRNLFELSVLNQIGRVCSQARSLNEVLSEVTGVIAESLFPDHCGFLIFDPERDALIPHFSFVLSCDRAAQRPIPVGSGITGKTLRTGEVHCLGDVRLDPDFIRTDSRTISELCVPVRVADGIVGVVNVECSSLNAFSEAEERLMIAIVDLVSATWERLDAADRQRNSEELFRTLVDQAADAFFLHDLDGRFIDVNRRACESLGYTRTELLGMTVFDVELNTEFHPLSLIWREFQMEQGMTLEGRHRRKDGSDFPVEVRLGCVNPQGRRMILALARDISARKESERQLRLTQFSIDRAVDAIFWVAPSSEILYVNDAACRTLGYTREQLVGNTVPGIDPNFPAEMWPSHWEELKQRGSFKFESIHATRDGQMLNTEVTVNYLQYEGREYNCAVMRDITEGKKSEERFSRLFYSSPFPIMVATYPGGKILDANDVFLQLFEFTREEILGKTTLELEIWDDIADRQVMLHSVECEKRLRNGVFWFRTKSGRKRLLLLSVEIIEIHGEETSLAMSIDITDRREAETALQESVSLLRSVSDGTTDAIFVKDLQGRYLLFNKAAARFVGKSVEEVLGRDDSELFEPESARRLMERDRALMLAGTVDTQEETLTAAGVTRTYLATKGPYRDHLGNIIGLIGISRDITERNRMQQELQSSQRMVQAVADASPLTIYLFDLQRRTIVYSNFRIIADLGYSPEDVQNWDWQRLQEQLHPDDLAYCVQLFDRWDSAPDNQILEAEYRIRHRDGSWHWMISRDKVFSRSEDGRVRKIVGTAQDVTERKRLEQQFRESQKMEAVGQLAGGIAHDFNNLLTIINGYSDLILSSQTGSEPWHFAVAEICDAGRRAAQLTQQLLSYSRRALIDPKVLSLNDVVVRSELLLRRLIGAHITLSVNPDPNLLPIRADSGQLDQVLLNLCVNARDAMPAGGHLSISTAQVSASDVAVLCDVRPGDDQYAQLTVTDNGNGIPADILPRIFEPFYTTKEVGKGTGLGLAVVHGIIRQSGGYLHVASHLGRGTTFTLWFPSVSVPCESATSPKSAVSRYRTEIVLIVEDEASVRKLIKTSLESSGYQVLEACNAAEALKLFSQGWSSVNLLLTDMVMPGMKGSQLAEIIRRELPGLPVLYISGYSADEPVSLLKPGGREAFLQKPFSPRDLVEAVDTLFRLCSADI